MRRCEVYMHGIKAGVLTEEDNRTFCFTYDKAYLLNEKSGPVSLTLPLQAEPYRSNVLFPVFANMLSEGENRQIQSQLLHIDAEDDFGILLARHGRRCSTVGRYHISLRGPARMRIRRKPLTPSETWDAYRSRGHSLNSRLSWTSLIRCGMPVNGSRGCSF